VGVRRARRVPPVLLVPPALPVPPVPPVPRVPLALLALPVLPATPLSFQLRCNPSPA